MLEYNMEVVITSASFFIFLYLLMMWNNYARNPFQRAIVPWFEPPGGLSPAALRYILRMKFDISVVIAALVSMATKGFLKLEQNDTSYYTLTKLSNDTSSLSVDEKNLANALFNNENPSSIALIPKNATAVTAARDNFREKLEENYKGRYFKTNLTHLAPAILASLLVAALAIITAREPLRALQALFLATIPITYFSIIGLQRHILSLMLKINSLSNIIAIFIFKIFIIAIFLFLLLDSYFALATTTSPQIALSLLALITLNIVFIQLLRVPNEEGRSLVNQIRGFKLFLTSNNTSIATPQTFEKFLPYAIALDAEMEWGAQFTSTYQPTWFRSVIKSDIPTTTLPAYLTTTLLNSLEAAISNRRGSNFNLT